MADNLVTLADALLSADAKNEFEVSQIVNKAPFVAALPTIVTKDGSTIYQYLKYTAAPEVVFREVNSGKEYSKSTREKVTVDMKYLDGDVEMDIAAAKVGGNPEGAIMKEAQLSLEQMYFYLQKQIINGTNNDATGFNGFADDLDTLANPMVVNGGGSGTSQLSSVYLVNVGADKVFAVTTGPIQGLGDVYKAKLKDESGKTFTGICMDANGHAAVVVATNYDVSRIANLDSDTHGLSDALISQAWKSHKAGRKPSVILANSQQIYQLQQSRASEFNPNPDWPTESQGIKILEVDSITSIEDAVS